jgi:predicted metal-binding membrane protein
LNATREWDLRDGALATGLAAVAALCWVLSVQRMQGMDMGPGTDLGSFSWFLPTWVIMMAAMMFPSALPAVVAFERTRRERLPIAQGVVFAAGYLAVWTAFGACAFLVYRILHNADLGLLDWDRGGRCLVAATAAAAGLYELTPIKRMCLERCRTISGRDDAPSLVAALRYGADCVGCSFALMVLLLVIGAMSITWMVVVAAILFVQKVPSAGPRTTLVTGLGLIALGAWIAIDPGSAPGLSVPMSM